MPSETSVEPGSKSGELVPSLGSRVPEQAFEGAQPGQDWSEGQKKTAVGRIVALEPATVAWSLDNRSQGQ